MLNQYVTFATGPGANTLSPATYTAHALRLIGHQPGIALAELENSALRQTTTAVAALAQFAADFGSHDVLDDGVAANFAIALKSALDAIIAAQQHWRTGDIKATLVNEVPIGWVLANGAYVRIADYPDLFAKFGTRFGPTTDSPPSFKLPDLRGEFLRGWDNGRGVDPDGARLLGSNQSDLFELHGHPYLANTGNNAPDPAGGIATDEEGVGTVHPAYTGTPVDLLQSRLIGGSGGDETRPRNVAVLYLIKT